MLPTTFTVLLHPRVILFEVIRFRTFSAFPMDLNSLKEQVSNLTLYDLKAGVRKVQNGKQKEI